MSSQASASLIFVAGRAQAKTDEELLSPALATAIDETVHHSTRRLRLLDGAFPSNIQMRELVANADCDLVDLCGQQESRSELYDPDDYRAAQKFGTGFRWPEAGAGENGIIYASVRRAGG